MKGIGDEALAPDGSLRHRLPKILKECEERLKVLRAVHRRVINRYSNHILNYICQQTKHFPSQSLLTQAKHFFKFHCYFLSSGDYLYRSFPYKVYTSTAVCQQQKEKHKKFSLQHLRLLCDKFYLNVLQQLVVSRRPWICQWVWQTDLLLNQQVFAYTIIIFFQVPLFSPVPWLLPGHGEGHQTGGLLQNHQ